MKVGLLRHFKVERGYPNKFVSSEQLMEWVKEYDASDVIPTQLDLGNIDWKRCYSSDLARARKTATAAFSGEIVENKSLREIEIKPLFHSSIKLPLLVHMIFIRIAWLLGHSSQPESKKTVKHKINLLLDEILQSEEDVLIVGHGGMMMFMSKELKRRGFTGPPIKRAKNGHLYIYDK
ncbi:histidine phosphatase family protein [Alkalihalobacillus sp. LMS39]|uniref:histidine phosphatase family protein n=1 Tax=Alkalihalobacillus sp. LMS39 TaxID=2924032 RepID=UPI001FB3179F|nr:histidine phosphatase family protein [Alkalihalobacillus sp. LMS39]UOE96222.1 histidine phosphatase family protein [Alkalihalobacillus sp. LMS39]